MKYDLQRLIDQAEITDKMNRYARCVDRRDWEGVRATFFDDATDNHGGFSGSGNGFVEWIKERHKTIDKATHLLGNCTIDFATDTLAIVETYFLASLILGADAGGHRQMLVSSDDESASKKLSVVVLGRYADRFEKRDGEWRVAKRLTIYDSTESRESNDDDSNKHGWALASRSSKDPLFEHFREVGLKVGF